jgi:hypothetical protein
MLRADGKPDVRTLVDAGSEEALRHDADDHKWPALDDERGAEEGTRVRKGARPEAITEDDGHAGRSGTFIWSPESASRRGSCTEHGEVVAGDHLGEDGADILTRAAAQGDGSSDVAFYGQIAQGAHGAHRFIDAKGEPYRVDDGGCRSIARTSVSGCGTSRG